METLLITGGCGFIGSNFIRYILERGLPFRVINLDKLTYAGNPENLRDLENHPRYRFHRGDIADEALVVELAREAQVIVNFAAETHVDRSIGDPRGFIVTDVLGVYSLLEAARKGGVRLFLQVSTDEVYGEAGDRPSTEEDPLLPKSPYAASKAGGDRLAYSYWTTYGTPLLITRCSNNYGPRQYPEKMIPLFLTNALEDLPLPVYGDGQNSRDWIHVTDHCRALEALIRAEGLEGEVFNIGSGEERSVLEVARAILRALGKSEDLISFVTDRPGHVRRHAVSTEKLHRAIGFKAQVTFEEGLEDTIRWYRDNEAWWRRIKSGEFREYYLSTYAGRGI
ncbi:MAG: dTDP-glucose 4,6-dehydratase [Nitrospinota bacterium]